MLPSHLKYIFLEEDEGKPIIISSSLFGLEEDAAEETESDDDSEATP